MIGKKTINVIIIEIKTVLMLALKTKKEMIKAAVAKAIPTA